MRPGTRLRRGVVGPTLVRLAPPGSIVLDVGGYDGSVLSSTPKLAGDVGMVVVDIDRDGVAKANASGVSAVLGSVVAIPIATASVDVALCLDVLPCLEPADVERAYAEIGRVLRPGGHALVTEVDERYRLPFADRAELYRSWGVRTGGLPYGRLVELLASNGIRVVQRQRFYGLLARTAYSVLFVHAWPRRGARAKHRLWGLVTALERRWCLLPQANFVLANRF